MKEIAIKIKSSNYNFQENMINTYCQYFHLIVDILNLEMTYFTSQETNHNLVKR